MFILRQINKEGVEFNLSLGEHYYLVTRHNQERFKYLMGEEIHPSSEKCYAFLLYSDHEKEQNWPLYEGFYYYLMTETGKTFANLTKRD